jgi:hypothetical protein
LKTGPNFFLQHSKNRIIFNFVKFVATKIGLTINFFTPLFCCCFWIRDPEWVKIRIRDKHPGSATLVLALLKAASQESGEDGLKETEAGRHSLVIAEADPLLSRLEEAAVLLHLQRRLNKQQTASSFHSYSF